ncbi:MAG: amino acid ABC transporter ATP-binding protein [Deltaproteobacteria bacterium]|nr:amino acid ABC transporter ATP-binding protein [Deltaproteobacteria bacterium]
MGGLRLGGARLPDDRADPEWRRRQARSAPRSTGIVSDELLRLEGVGKRFGQAEVLAGIDLGVARGEVVAVIGPSGSGKSTLLRCINHLSPPTSGHVWFDGKPIGERHDGTRWVARPEREVDAQRARIGMVFQRFHLFPTSPRSRT